MARLGHGRKKVPGKGDKLPYHGRSAGYGAFVYPSKAPGSGSFPIGDLWHARYAVITVMSSTFDGSPAKRKKVLRAVAEEWPQYNWAAYWNKTAKKKSDLKSWDSLVGVASKKRRKAANPRRNTMARRRRNSGNYLENPLGMPLSGNIQAVIVDEHYRRRRGSAEKAPKRVHIKKGKYALCGAGKGRVVAGPDKGRVKGVKPSDSKTITCYRCLKLHNINQGDDVERMIRAPGRRETHMMIPGGREGIYISRKQLEHDDYPSRGAQVSGIEYFLGGTDAHPTQSRLLSARQKRAREDDLRKRRSRRGAARKPVVAMRGRQITNPRSYTQGYERGLSDYHETEPLPASQLTSRSESYQFGYLEGYADQAGGGRKTTSRRAKPARRSYKAKARRTKRRTNRGGDTKKGRMSNGRMWYMVDGKFATKSRYDSALRRRKNGSAGLFRPKRRRR